jgi:predicted O-linked N-acetylglucosamine transferase (SPINDLY family)
MGVPFITLADRPSVGRLGSCVLQAVGHPEWIANSDVEYVAKAVALTRDRAGLAAIHGSLREQMQRSPLMDERGFAQKIEAAYREMFEAWSASES